MTTIELIITILGATTVSVNLMRFVDYVGTPRHRKPRYAH